MLGSIQPEVVILIVKNKSSRFSWSISANLELKMRTNSKVWVTFIPFTPSPLILYGIWGMLLFVSTSTKGVWFLVRIFDVGRSTYCIGQLRVSGLALILSYVSLTWRSCPAYWWGPLVFPFFKWGKWSLALWSLIYTGWIHTMNNWSTTIWRALLNGPICMV